MIVTHDIILHNFFGLCNFCSVLLLSRDSGPWVGLGYHAIDQYDGPNQQVVYGNWISHKDFDAGTMNNDIALIQLHTPVSMNSDVQAISISSNEPKKGLKLLVSGWGNLDRKLF